MCNPNLFGAILAKMTRDQGLDDVALVQLGATLAATSPPIRIAEEYAVLDCISGGRLVAGVPLQRTGRPEEVAQTIVFVSSDKAPFITGASFAVDGGKTVQ